MKEFVKSTFVGGVLFLLPVVIVLYFAGHAAQIVGQYMVQPVASGLNIGPAKAIGVVVTALVLTAFCAGILARRSLARRLNAWFWDNFLDQPQYEPMRSMALGLEQGVGHGATSLAARPVLIQNSGGFELAFHVETLENGLMVVHVPGVPLPKSGRLLYLPPDQVVLLDLPADDVFAIMRASGAGSSRALRGVTANASRLTRVG